MTQRRKPKPAEQEHRRPRCPVKGCGRVLGSLAERAGPKGAWKAPYRDPRDEAAMYRCPVHGRAAIYPDGRIVPAMP